MKRRKLTAEQVSMLLSDSERTGASCFCTGRRDVYPFRLPCALVNACERASDADRRFGSEQALAALERAGLA